jgi:hypothetical protein
MLVRGGWPWTLVTMTVRSEYMEALEKASVENDIRPFARLIGQSTMFMMLRIGHRVFLPRRFEIF